MTEQEINVAIAEAVGWKISPCKSQFKRPGDEQWRGRGYDSIWDCIPNFCTDLNAMHDAVISTKIDDQRWSDALKAVIQDEYCCGAVDARYKTANATARQRAEAFLRTLGKWRDEP